MTKHKIFTTLALAVAALSCSLAAEEESYVSDVRQALVHADQFNYIRLGAGKVTLNSHTDIGPGIHFGRRYELDDDAVDISFNCVHCEGSGDHKSSDFVSVPRIMYFNFQTPLADSSLFFGPGVSWGWLNRDGKNKEFMGLCLEGSVGYEFKRCSTIRTIVQLDVSQPLIAARKKGGLPGPVIEASVGIGF